MSYLRYKDYIVGGISEWTKPEIKRMTYFLREKAQEEKRIGRGEFISSFLVSFLPSASDRRRSTLTADAYEADVKTFVKYEGTWKIDSSAPSGMKRRALDSPRRDERGEVRIVKSP